MRKNSWLSQWGILVIWGIPCLLRGGKKEALFAILLACLMALVTTLWFGRRRENLFGMKQFFLRRANEIPVAKGWLRYRGIKKMFRKIFFCSAGLLLSIFGIVKVALWYSEAVQNVWIILGMLVVVLLIGRRCDRPGKSAMENLWGKVVLVCILVLFTFQIPGLLETKENFAEMGMGAESTAIGKNFKLLQAIQYGVEVFLLTLPALYMEICLKNSQASEADKERDSIGMLFYRWGSLWIGFLVVYLCLMTLWEVQILKMAPFPYLLLGQTSKSFSGQGMRLETINFMVVIVSLYFASIQCMDVFRSWIGGFMRKEKESKRKKTIHLKAVLIFSVVLLSGFTCAGCSVKLGEKKLVLIGDENQVATRDSNTEFSCMQFLILHTKSFEELAKDLLNQPNISYETYVAFSKKPIEEDIRKLMEEADSAQAMKIVDELVKKGTKTGDYEYVTIREFLNACAKKETVMLPVLEIVDGEIRVTEFVEYKNFDKND